MNSLSGTRGSKIGDGMAPHIRTFPSHAFQASAKVSPVNGAGEKDFELCDGGLFGWSGIAESMEFEHKTRMVEKVKNRSLIKVACATLQSVLAEAGIKTLDYCVLDIEGAEWPVLMAYDWSVPVEVFEIEDNFGNYPIDAFMAGHGYKKLIRLGVSNLYRKDIAKGLPS